MKKIHEMDFLWPQQYCAILVNEDGILYHKEYQKDYYTHYLMNIKSCSKLLLSLAVGLCIKEHLIHGVQDHIDDYLPKDVKENIKPTGLTIEDLLMMHTDISWCEGGKSQEIWRKSPHWALNYLLRQKNSEKKFNYCTANAYLIALMIETVSKKKTFEYINEHIFQPLNIENYAVNRSPEGYDYGGSDFYIAPIDFAKVMTLLFCDHSIISKQWVEKCLTKHIKVKKHLYYGYYFFCYEEKQNEIWVIPGSGGQFVLFSKEKKLALLVTSLLEKENCSCNPLESDMFKKTLAYFTSLL